MITPMHTIGEALLTALSGALSGFFAFIPRLAGAAILLLIGVVAGRLAGRLLTRALRMLEFDQIAERAEIGPLLRGVGVRVDPADAIGALARWFVYLVALQAAAGVLGFPQITQIVNSIIGFIPRIILAVLIVLVGALVGAILARAVRGSLGTARYANAGQLAALIRWGALIVAAVAALSQLEVAPTIVNGLWIAVVGGSGLALALAFGLGAREAAGSVAVGRLVRADLEPGTTLSIDGQEGEIERIGLIFTTIRSSGRQLQIPNIELTRRTLASGPGQAGAGSDRYPLAAGTRGERA